MKKSSLSYIHDLAYGALKYPSGWLKPEVVKGYFHKNQKGHLQKTYFNELLKMGFKRTYWQLIFPEQTAGLVSMVSKDLECHIRFYHSGAIDCELEFGRFNPNHWSGFREHNLDIIEELLYTKTNLDIKIKKQIHNLFEIQYYSNLCCRKI